MAIYNPLIPGDTQTIAAGPKDIRDNMDGIVTGQVVNAGLLNGLASGNTAGKIPVSNGVVNDGLNADKLDGQDGSYFSPSTHGHSVATGSSNGYMANTDKTKIDGIAAGSEVNQMAFSNILIGSTTIQADSKTDTLEFVAGANISITPDVTNDRVTIDVSGTVPSATKSTYATTAGSASYLSNFSVTGRSAADINSYRTSGMFAFDATPANAPSAYLAGFSSANSDAGLQIVGGFSSDNLWFRGWANSGSTFFPWRHVVHSGNIASQSVNYATTAGSAPAKGGISSKVSAGLGSVEGPHDNTLFHLHAELSNPLNNADLILWASEPNVSYTGTGIGNNYYHSKRYSTVKGASFIRFLDNTIVFSTINAEGSVTNVASMGPSGYLFNNKQLATTDMLPAISTLKGTISHGGTIPLPSGYSQSQCVWMVSNNTTIEQAPGDKRKGHYCSADDGRVVSVYSRNEENPGSVNYGIANYIIIGVK